MGCICLLDSGIPFVGFERGYFLDIQSFFPQKHLIGYKILSGHCNLQCYYCHRRVFLDGKYSFVSTRKILAGLSKLQFFNTIVLTGGEITLHYQAAINIMEQLRKKGITTLFSTNGSFPRRVEHMLPFADVIKIDIKGHKSQYKHITGDRKAYDFALQSIAIASEKKKVEVKLILHSFTEPIHINQVLEDIYRQTDMPPNLCIEFQPVRDFLGLGIAEPEIARTLDICARAKPLPRTTLLKHYGEKERIYRLENGRWKIFLEKEIPLRFNWDNSDPIQRTS